MRAGRSSSGPSERLPFLGVCQVASLNSGNALAAEQFKHSRIPASQTSAGALQSTHDRMGGTYFLHSVERPGPDACGRVSGENVAYIIEQDKKACRYWNVFSTYFSGA